MSSTTPRNGPRLRHGDRTRENGKRARHVPARWTLPQSDRGCTVARANSRTCLGLTTATSGPEAASSPARIISAPPVASSTIIRGISASRRSTTSPMHRESSQTCQISPVGRTATSKRSSDTSMPTNTGDSFIQYLPNVLTGSGPALHDSGSTAQSTVRAPSRQDATTQLSHDLQDPGLCGLPRPLPRYQDTRTVGIGFHINVAIVLTNADAILPRPPRRS